MMFKMTVCVTQNDRKYQINLNDVHARGPYSVGVIIVIVGMQTMHILFYHACGGKTRHVHGGPKIWHIFSYALTS